MSDGLKVVSHFLKNLDKTLKILANRKNESLRRAIETNLENIQKPPFEFDKSKIVEFTRTNSNLLKVSNQTNSNESHKNVYCLSNRKRPFFID